MDPINFAKKRVLIVDDLPEARVGVHRMMRDFGATEIKAVSGGKEAVEALQEQSYDIVLCDYNLGEGKDGQQILEEVRYNKLLKNTATFVLITAENTTDMVMGALEYAPDSYVTKPFTKGDLRTRLIKLLEMKQLLHPLDSAIDKGDLAAALKACDVLAPKAKEYAGKILRTKGQLLFEANMLDESEKLYQQILSRREMPWALLGLGKVSFAREDYAAAKDYFEKLTAQNQFYVPAFDWLAKCEEALGDYQAAQETIQKAIGTSPKAVLRQMELARLAEHNQDEVIAEKAYKQSVNLGKDSCYKNPESYLGLAKSLQYKVQPSGDRESRNATADALRALTAVQKEFGGNDKVALKATVLEGETHFHSGKEEDGKKCIAKAEDIYDGMDDADASDAVELAKGFIVSGDIERAEELIEEAEAEGGVNDTIAADIKRVKLRVENESLNNQGVELFQAGKVKEAVAAFEKALEIESTDKVTLLNAIQVSLKLAEKDSTAKKTMMANCKGYFKVLKIRPNDPRKERFQTLKDMYDKMRK